jgi:predicted CxxxxCH...CXXCH cytochrome family protein
MSTTDVHPQSLAPFHRVRPLERAALLLVVVTLAPLAGCEAGEPFADGYGPRQVTCSSCHGSALNAAPPMALDGSTDTTAIGVGAHQAHLRDGSIRLALACTECHVVPDAIDDTGHIDPLPADMWFGPLSMTGGLLPEWDRKEASCSATYCHGGDRAGAEHPAPVWTLVDGSQKTCASCHGAPPPAPHVQDTRCSRCHSLTVSFDGRIQTGNATHINGLVDVDALTCTSCHGSGDNPAPPAAVGGQTETSFTGVGAHAVHTNGTALHAAFACETCHLVPLVDDAVGHRDTPLPAEVVFGGLAIGDGPSPMWDGVGCSNVACHGSGSIGASHPEPIWTVIDGSQKTCTSCHGMPPPAPHVQNANCAACHGLVVYEQQIIAPALHVNGVVDVVEPSCASCHGTLNFAGAPPVDLDGNVDTTSPGVGAHITHLLGTERSSPVACSECHIVPLTVDATSHIDDDGAAELTFGAVASAGGSLSPIYENLTCSNIACHGGDGSSGGSLTTPQWNVVDGTQAACGTCHGLPPALPHPPRTDCASCHGSVVNAEGGFVNAWAHVNGVVNVGVACDSCHGGDGESAPPRDTTGQTATTARGVGAHRSHVEGSANFGPVACNECHLVPATPDVAGHYDTALPAEVKFGDVAETNGVDPWWDGVGCSNVACHGAGLPNEGGLHMEPVWTVTDGSQTTCFSCHGFPPQGTHPQSFACEGCHAAVIAEGAFFVRPDLHANGVINFMSAGANDFTDGFMNGANHAP